MIDFQDNVSAWRILGEEIKLITIEKISPRYQPQRRASSIMPPLSCRQLCRDHATINVVERARYANDSEEKDNLASVIPP